MHKVFLIGYMGCGKTTVGKKLAARMHLPFMDLDAEVERVAGMTIPQIFRTQGEAAFRDLERSTLEGIASQVGSFILSTGGGTPCLGSNMDLMLRSGIVVYLQLSPNVLAARLLHNKARRPLVAYIPDGELPTFIAQHLAEREPWYHRAHIAMDSAALSGPDLDAFAERLKNYSK